MPNPRSGLTLVDEPESSGLNANVTLRAGGLAHRLEEVFREAFGAEAFGDGLPPANAGAHPSQEQRIPYSIRLTTEHVLRVAEDADLRAQMLRWSKEEMPSSSQMLRKASALDEAAIGLRRIAAHLKDGWDDPKEVVVTAAPARSMAVDRMPAMH